MDNTKLEMQAEEYISSTLSRHDFLVSKPKYDVEGCDLQILDHPSRPTRLLRIQSKGRTVKSTLSVDIPKTYVSDNFILFLYIVNNDKSIELYIFFPEQVEQFSSDEKNYTLYSTKGTFETKYFNCRFTNERASELKRRLNASKIKEETTVIIDSFSLERGIRSTIQIYSEIYPERQFSKPNFLEIIRQILKYYDRNKSDGKTINVYRFLTPQNSNSIVFYKSEDLLVERSKIRIFEMYIDGFIAFEIEDFLRRVINSENILLVTSDVAYLPLLQELKSENKEIVLVCEKIDNGLRDYGFKWGDIAYPVGYSLGLKQHEL